jgi:hypothetical protein
MQMKTFFKSGRLWGACLATSIALTAEVHAESCIGPASPIVFHGEPFEVTLSWTVQPEVPEFLENPTIPSFTELTGSETAANNCKGQGIVGVLNCDLISPMKNQSTDNDLGPVKSPEGDPKDAAKTDAKEAPEEPKVVTARYNVTPTFTQNLVRATDGSWMSAQDLPTLSYVTQAITRPDLANVRPSESKRIAAASRASPSSKALQSIKYGRSDRESLFTKRQMSIPDLGATLPDGTKIRTPAKFTISKQCIDDVKKSPLTSWGRLTAHINELTDIQRKMNAKTMTHAAFKQLAKLAKSFQNAQKETDLSDYLIDQAKGFTIGSGLSIIAGDAVTTTAGASAGSTILATAAKGATSAGTGVGLWWAFWATMADNTVRRTVNWVDTDRNSAFRDYVLEKIEYPNRPRYMTENTISFMDEHAKVLESITGQKVPKPDGAVDRTTAQMRKYLDDHAVPLLHYFGTFEEINGAAAFPRHKGNEQGRYGFDRRSSAYWRKVLAGEMSPALTKQKKDLQNAQKVLCQ